MRIGVVIPLFRQSEYLIECVTSVLAQTLQPMGIVIVNDGCPNPSSDALPRAIAAAWPLQILYVRQENRGVGGARNTGVRALLTRWPEIEAIFPLDADNWLDTYALGAMAARLTSEDQPDWVYPDMQRFGIDFIDWKPWPKLNRFRLIFRNQCDAGCLIHRRLFDAGLFFDETMRPQGFEDWEFFLRAAFSGFRGVSAGQVGFYYRVKRNSMLTEATINNATNPVHDRHSELMKPWHLVACEHKYMPRFRFIDEELKVRDFSDPLLSPAYEQILDTEYTPPITILGSAAAFDVLNRAGMMRGLLLSIQHDVRTGPLRIDFAGEGSGLRFERQEGLGRNPVLFAFQINWVKEGRISTHDFHSALAGAGGLSIGGGHPFGPLVSIDFAPLLGHACALASNEVERSPGPLQTLAPSNTLFARHHHLLSESFEMTYPLAYKEGVNLCFVVPWLRLGGVDQCVVLAAEAIKRLKNGVRVHLLLTEAGVVDFDRANLRAFDEIVSVAHWEQGQRLKALAGVLGSMDVVINAHSLAGYQALPLLPRRPQAVHRPFCIAYLHLIGAGKDQRPIGYPYLACEYESEIDVFLVISEQLRDFLCNSGVNEERIRIARNAPVVQPGTLERALLLSDKKATRQLEAGYGFQLMFAGRLDWQKGVSRLAEFMRLAEREGVKLELTIVGSATVDGEKVDWPSGHVRVIEPTMDRAELAGYFEEADGVILLSRAEGVPLVLLDAMAHGCTVVATDVGAVGELVVNEVNGFLCTSAGSDDDIAGAALEQIKRIIGDRTGCRELRRRAVETAMRFTWDQLANTLNEYLVAGTQSRHSAA